MDKLITLQNISTSLLRKVIFDQITIKETDRQYMHIYDYFLEIMLSSATEYKQLYDNYDKSIITGVTGLSGTVHNTELRQLQNYQEYKKNVLMFWTGSRGIARRPPYQVYFQTDIDAPKSHTCFHQLELPTWIASKQELYDIFMNIFLLKQHKIFSDR